MSIEVHGKRANVRACSQYDAILNVSFFERIKKVASFVTFQFSNFAIFQSILPDTKWRVILWKEDRRMTAQHSCFFLPAQHYINRNMSPERDEWQQNVTRQQIKRENLETTRKWRELMFCFCFKHRILWSIDETCQVYFLLSSCILW